MSGPASAADFAALIRDHVAAEAAGVTGRRMVVHALDEDGVVVAEPDTGDVHDEPYAYVVQGPGAPGDAVLVGEVAGRGPTASRTRVVHGRLMTGPRPVLLPGESDRDAVSDTVAEDDESDDAAAWATARTFVYPRPGSPGLDPAGSYDVTVEPSVLLRVTGAGPAAVGCRVRLVGAATADDDGVSATVSNAAPSTTRVDCSARFAGRAPASDGRFRALLQFRPTAAGVAAQARNPAVAVTVRRRS